MDTRCKPQVHGQSSLVQLFRRQSSDDLSSACKESPAKSYPAARGCFNFLSTRVPRKAIEKSIAEVVAAETLSAEKAEELKLAKQRIEQARSQGLMIEPELKDHGSRRGGRPSNSSIKYGVIQGHKSNRKPMGSSVLRRDPSAQAKLGMLRPIEAEMRKCGLKSFTELPSSIKRSWEDYDPCEKSPPRRQCA